jgi:hypothetical protein
LMTISHLINSRAVAFVQIAGEMDYRHEKCPPRNSLLSRFDEVRVPLDDSLMLTMAPFGRSVAETMWEAPSSQSCFPFVGSLFIPAIRWLQGPIWPDSSSALGFLLT